jgi:hypothetical protein
MIADPLQSKIFVQNFIVTKSENELRLSPRVFWDPLKGFSTKVFSNFLPEK